MTGFTGTMMRVKRKIRKDDIFEMIVTLHTGCMEGKMNKFSYSVVVGEEEE